MELEEAIKMVEYIKNETKLACEFPKATERDKNRWGKEVQALEVVLHYIKEESISRAIVEDRVKELKLIREEEEKTRFVLSYSIYNAITKIPVIEDIDIEKIREENK